MNVLVQTLRKPKPFPFFFVADSKSFISKSDRTQFSREEITTIIDWKRRRGNSTLPTSFSKHDIQNARDEIEKIKEIIDSSPREWVIIDSTSSPLEKEYSLTKSLLGIHGYSTANKTVWADFGSFRDLYQGAEKKRTLLGLNCTTGVWVNQIDILSIISDAYRSGHVHVRKRDNSSLNFFFSKIGRSGSISQAMEELQTSGHLEPNASGLTLEVRDQAKKANIALNLLSTLLKISPSFEDNASPEGSSGQDTPKSQSPIDIGNWHRNGRRSGQYPCLLTKIDFGHGILSCSIGFVNLMKGDPLARNFEGKNAMVIEPESKTAFSWYNCGTKIVRKRNSSFACSGYGGADRTATKLLAEASFMASLSFSDPLEFFSPIPVLFGLRAAGTSYPAQLEKNIARALV